MARTMNKTERLGYKWLIRQGFKEIVYQRSRSPDFLTEKGGFEVKRGYKLKTGDIKILFTPGQREILISKNAKVLVFLDDPEPVAIIPPDELDKRKVGNIILHDVEYKKQPIGITLTKELLKAIDIEREKLGLTRSAFIEYCLRNQLFEGKRRGFQY